MDIKKFFIHFLCPYIRIPTKKTTKKIFLKRTTQMKKNIYFPLYMNPNLQPTIAYHFRTRERQYSASDQSGSSPGS